MPEITAIVCRRGGPRVVLGKCVECFIENATLLCDGPRKKGSKFNPKIPGADKVCSKPLCRYCATSEGDKDYCTEHKEPASRRLSL